VSIERHDEPVDAAKSVIFGFDEMTWFEEVEKMRGKIASG